MTVSSICHAQKCVFPFCFFFSPKRHHLFGSDLIQRIGWYLGDTPYTYLSVRHSLVWNCRRHFHKSCNHTVALMSRISVTSAIKWAVRNHEKEVEAHQGRRYHCISITFCSAGPEGPQCWSAKWLCCSAGTEASNVLWHSPVANIYLQCGVGISVFFSPLTFSLLILSPSKLGAVSERLHGSGSRLGLNHDRRESALKCSNVDYKKFSLSLL